MHGPDYQAQTGLQNRVIQDLAFLRRRVGRTRPTGRKGKAADSGAPLVVVFIDDLDRCSEQKVMEILQAINLILGASEYFVFLALDTAMIYRAIGKHYELGQKESVTGDFAESYLRKIIQLSFHLPEIGVEQRLQYVVELFSPEARREFSIAQQRTPSEQGENEQGQRLSGFSSAWAGPWSYDFNEIRLIKETIVHEVEDTADELIAFAGLKEFIDENPREIKRLVNVHRLIKILVQRSADPPTPARQRKLVVWLVFCANCGDLIDDAFALARDTPSCRDVLSLLIAPVDAYPTQTWLTKFARTAAEIGPLTASDLAAGSLLAEAARISRMVRDIPPPSVLQSTTDEPAANGEIQAATAPKSPGQ